LEEDQGQTVLLLLHVQLALEVGLVADVHVLGALVGNELVGLLLPLPEPVDHAAVENCWGRRCPASETGVIRVHHEYDVQLLLHSGHKAVLDFAVLALLAMHFLERVDQLLVFVTLEQTGDISTGEQSIHTLHEGHVGQTALLKNEDHVFGNVFLFGVQACSLTHKLLQVVVEFFH